jgi:hypothetical protein
VKRTGVVIAVSQQLTLEQARDAGRLLEQRFPGVRFALAGGALSSVAFEWDDGDEAAVAAVVTPPTPADVARIVIGGG